MRALAVLTTLALSLPLGLACASAPEPEPEPEPAPERDPAPAAPSSATSTATPVELRPELGERITAAGYTGVFVLLDPTRGLIVSDAELAERGFIPASTFKIPNSLIALETGVADSPGFMLAWDGVVRGGADWDRDHDLHSAFQASAVWYYQELARRIGTERMSEWLRAADYGNADISGGIDQFWLAGGLRISARQQVEFLRRLDTGETPFSPAVVATFLDEVMLVDEHDGISRRAKTGWAKSEEFPDPASAGFEGNQGWYVGSIRQPTGERVYFAILLFAPEPTPSDFGDDRRALANALMLELGVAL